MQPDEQTIPWPRYSLLILWWLRSRQLEQQTGGIILARGHAECCSIRVPKYIAKQEYPSKGCGVRSPVAKSATSIEEPPKKKRFNSTVACVPHSLLKTPFTGYIGPLAKPALSSGRAGRCFWYSFWYISCSRFRGRANLPAGTKVRRETQPNLKP